MAKENRQGTKAVFGSWLSVKKGMTRTKYTTLPTEKKLEIQKEYSGRGRTSVREPGESNQVPEGKETTV